MTNKAFGLWSPAAYGFAIGLAGLSFTTPSEAAALARVACVGDSITQGYGLASPDQAYPADLQVMFGSAVAVMNFGVSGRTLLSTGDSPYINEQAYQMALQFAGGLGDGPLVDVTIMLGTNDSKPGNWTTNAPAQFKTDAIALIQSFTTLPSKPVVFLVLPPEAWANQYGISGTVIDNQIIPILRAVADQTGAHLIDVNTPTKALQSSFTDGVHPDAAGAQVIAKTIFDAIVASQGGGSSNTGGASSSAGSAGQPASVGGSAAASAGTGGSGGAAAGVAGAGAASGASAGGASAAGAPSAGAGAPSAGGGVANGGASAGGGPASNGGATGGSPVGGSTAMHSSDSSGCAISTTKGRNDARLALALLGLALLRRESRRRRAESARQKRN